MLWHKLNFFLINLLWLWSCYVGKTTEAGATVKTKYNVTMQQLVGCKEYDIRGSGYTYTDFFLVHYMDNKKVADDELLHLKFYVLTTMDAHILLSVNDRPRLFDRVYEVVIGAGGNTFSTIRTSMGRHRVATNQDPHILSAIDVVPIEVIQKKDGNVLVYINGFLEGPLLNFTDPSPLNIQYISFSSFANIWARWFYDCPNDGFEKEIEPEKRLLLPQQRILNDLYAKTANMSMPLDLKVVKFAFHINAIAYKQEASVLQTRLDLNMRWQDAQLSWNPEDYNGITTLVRPTLNIWQPQLIVLNGALDSFTNILRDYRTTIDCNGSISLAADNVELRTYCPNLAKNWPHDMLHCELMFALEEFGVKLEYDARSALAEDGRNSVTEWKLMEIDVSSIADILNFGGMVRALAGALSVELSIVRNSAFYKHVFTVPILACHILILLSFTLRGYRRGALICVVLILLSLGMMYITRHAPAHYVPNMLTAYKFVLQITTLCYILHIMLMWLQNYPPKSQPHHMIMCVVNSSPLRLLLCMRFADSTDYVNIQSSPWREIGKILNNFFFVVINILLILIDVILLPQ